MNSHANPRHEAERLARAWIQGWIDGKPDDIPLADDFVHSSPFGTVRGRETYLEWVKPMAEKSVAGITIRDVIGAEGRAAITFDLETPAGIVPSCDWVFVADGTIREVNSYYDSTKNREALADY